MVKRPDDWDNMAEQQQLEYCQDSLNADSRRWGDASWDGDCEWQYGLEVMTSMYSWVYDLSRRVC
jgi:hypothetical protein